MRRKRKLPTTARFSDEFQTHSRIGPLWTTFKNPAVLKCQFQPTDFAEEAFFGFPFVKGRAEAPPSAHFTFSRRRLNLLLWFGFIIG
jgi:hypothetical protein